jgi:hypothetical protein
MAPDASSNIRVFVRWHDQTVFAGEEVKCTITFKNIASSNGQQKPQTQSPQLDRHRLASPLLGRNKLQAGLTPPPPTSNNGRGHRRAALSLSQPPSSSRSRSGSIQWPQTQGPENGRSGHGHNRSVSIVSIGSTGTVEDHHQRNDTSGRPRPPRGHARASSLQIVPRAQVGSLTGSQTSKHHVARPCNP